MIMFIKTFKTSRAELVIMLIGLVCFIATVWYIVAASSSGGTRNTSSTPSTQTEHFLINARTADDRVKFLSQFGWEVEPDPLDVREITVPAQFDEVYTGYNQIQKALGFDLEKYKGCRVKKWEYAVTNYPGEVRNVKATILISDGRVIGGDISASGAEKFTHSLMLAPEGQGREENSEKNSHTD